ncbi:energy-coupling factor transporter transmembrane component T [Luteipulveratus mongoliensis]|uniref:Cobalt ABC transporter permease n=1 Tax=Luteipulveratus mongoliensis TaxID=571913 RepID=A0A0K1JKQ3_9MICO|nr:energy-coupling factor transporter transmembrane component T [Luteipulveratus mongoliensis]AKU17173.1 cobalt ABC transporter permease [Luteipulveratus mongoliensis]
MTSLADRLSPPRLLHPVAWWLWGLLLAAAASRTTNPAYLIVLMAVVGWVVLLRRETGASTTLAIFMGIALVAVAIRVTMTVLLGSGVGGRTEMLSLPQVPLPDWMAGVQLGGPVMLESFLDAVYHGLQLAAILICVGACNVLADPRRLLRYVPATLYDVGTAVVVALTYVPQLADDARRIRTARRLRGHSGRGLGELARLVVPVLESSLDRSLTLAASMESRGYGRVTLEPRVRRRATLLTMIGLGGVLIGLYGLLDSSTPQLLGLPMLLLGCGCAVAALMSGARRDRRTPYRRDPWGIPESLVVATACLAPVVMSVAASRGDAGVVPPQVPAAWPTVSLLLVGALVLPIAAGALAPRPPRRAALEDAYRHRADELEVAA